MIDSRVKISNDHLGSYKDEREFDMSDKMQRRLMLCGYSCGQSQQRLKPRYISLRDEFIEHAF